jgi:hypothetical protein
MAAAAAEWLLETMHDCAYADHAIKELQELEARLAQGRASGANVYFLHNFDVLIDCALRDFEVYDARRRRMNSAFDRNCLVVEGRADELHKWVAVTVARVQTMLAAAGDAGAVGERQEQRLGDADRLRQRLADVRDMVDGILRDLGGAERGGKKARTHAVLWGGGRALLQMSALLAQMRA